MSRRLHWCPGLGSWSGRSVRRDGTASHNTSVFPFLRDRAAWHCHTRAAPQGSTNTQFLFSKRCWSVNARYDLCTCTSARQPGLTPQRVKKTSSGRQQPRLTLHWDCRTKHEITSERHGNSREYLRNWALAQHWQHMEFPLASPKQPTCFEMSINGLSPIKIKKLGQFSPG